MQIPIALIAGGNWNNGAHAGARCVNVNNYPWNVNTNIGGRGACDCYYFLGALLYGAAAQLPFYRQSERFTGSNRRADGQTQKRLRLVSSISGGQPQEGALDETARGFIRKDL